MIDLNVRIVQKCNTDHNFLGKSPRCGICKGKGISGVFD